MGKIIAFISLLIYFSPLKSQENIQIPDSNYQYISIESEIVDHSDIQKYITSHRMVYKEKAFVHGYRIQIFTSPDKNNAQKVKSEFYAKYSGLRCYLTYQQPYYRIRVGDYETQQEAKGDLRKLARQYPSSFLVADIITKSNKDED